MHLHLPHREVVYTSPHKYTQRRHLVHIMSNQLTRACMLTIPIISRDTEISFNFSRILLDYWPATNGPWTNCVSGGICQRNNCIGFSRNHGKCLPAYTKMNVDKRNITQPCSAPGCPNIIGLPWRYVS